VLNNFHAWRSEGLMSSDRQNSGLVDLARTLLQLI
jgi:hypothetical protein